MSSIAITRIFAPRWAAALCGSLAVTLGDFSAGAQGPHDLLTTSIETALVEERLVGATWALVTPEGTTTGAADDLLKATDVAHDMVTRYGMDANVGHVVYEERQPVFLEAPEPVARGGVHVSERTAEAIDAAVRALVDAAFERATRVLTANRAVLERCASELLTHETVEEGRLKELTAGLVRELGGGGIAARDT